MRMDVYDHIFVGAGLAAHTLAARLTQKAPGLKVLFLDVKNPYESRHSWCYWETKPLLPPHLIERQWQSMTIGKQDQSFKVDIRECPYHLVFSDRILCHLRGEIEKKGISRFEMDEMVLDIDGTVVTTEKGRYRGRHIWDSRLDLNEFEPETVLQDFLECEVVASKPVWSPHQLTLMDFVHESRAVYFLYLLPLDACRAIVTPTSFTLEPIDPQYHKTRMIAYLQERYALSEDEIKIESQTSGRLPMGFLRRPTRKIGVAGGHIRASTGYAFLQHLKGTPYTRVDRWMDTQLLSLMKECPEMMPLIFCRLFKRCPTLPLIRFLQGEGSLVDRLQVIGSMPKGPFLKTVMR